jgi:hypothetical protein
MSKSTRGFIVHHGKTGRRRRFSCALSSTGHKITKSNLRFIADDLRSEI